MREFKELDKKLRRLFDGDTYAFPDVVEVRKVLTMIKNGECKKPTRQKSKFQKFIQGLKNYCESPDLYIKSDYLDPILGLMLSNFLDFAEKGMGLGYLVGLPNNYTFADYVNEFCNPTIKGSKDGIDNGEVIEKYKSPNWEEYENVFLPTMEVQDVVDFFSVLKKAFKNEGRPFLDEVQFNDFIMRSFCGDKEIQKPKIFIPPASKMALVKLFYNFYEYCRAEISYTRKSVDYLFLLKEAFDTDTFQNVDKSNFNKTKSTFVWKVFK